MTTPKLDAWSILVAKAQRALDTQQQQLAQAQTRREQLKASEQRLQNMLMEYRLRQMDDGDHGRLMADRLNERRFIAQLQQLLDQSLRATTQADLQCRHLARVVIAARLELDKAEKIREQMRERERAAANHAEQRRNDDLAVMRYQWRHS